MGVGALKRAVFLDRDGVLNEALVRDGLPYPPATAAEVRLVEGAEEGLHQLKALGFLLIVVTNQPDVARGTQTLEQVAAINAKLSAVLPLDDILMCLHSGDGCDCRKPKPGLLRLGAARYDVDLGECYLIGDRWRDMDAASAVGVPGVWIDYGYRERGPSEPPAAVVPSMQEAVRWIVERERNSCK
jgi:D-glycero-D-manno-heptose 1,7-bisphosphate phosphatase